MVHLSSLQSLQPFWAWPLCPWGTQCGNVPGQGASRAKVLNRHPRPFPGIQFLTLSLTCLLIHNRKEAISHSSSADANPAHTCLTGTSGTRSVRPGKYLGFFWVHLQMGTQTTHSLVQQTLTHTRPVPALVGTAGVCWSRLVTDP